MLLQQAIPPGPPVELRDAYTGLMLGEHAPPARPYLVSNFVSSVDGKATAGSRSAPLADAADREAFHLLRTQADAILVGSGTLRVERYGSLVRDESLRQIRIAEGREAQPLAVLISRSGDVPFDIPLFADPASRIVLYTCASGLAPRCAAAVQVHHVTPGEEMLVRTMESLREEHGVRSVLCEGGPTLMNGLLAEDLLDELFLTFAPTLIGGSELGVSEGAAIPAPRALQLVRVLERDGYMFMRYARARSGE